MNDLGPTQQAIYRIISEYSKSPIDSEHLHINSEDGKSLLRFEYEPSLETEFYVFAEFFEHHYVLHFEGWHDEFPVCDTPSETAQMVLAQLESVFEGKVRLRITSAGKSPYKWQLVFDEGLDWCVMHITGLLFYNYFARRKWTEKANRVIG